MYYVYILKSKRNGKFYIGLTCNLPRRVWQHNNAHTKSTLHGIPWQVVYYEAYCDKNLASKTESFYKTSQGRRQIKKKLRLQNND